MSDTVKLHPSLGPIVLENKALFGSLFLYVIEGNTFIFRPILISEAESIYHLSEHLDEWVIDEWIVSKTIITDNLDYILNHAPAGLCASLSASILTSSTTEDIKEVARLLDEERASRSSTASVLDSMVKVGAGHLLKNTKNITYKQQIQYVAFAEELTGKKLELSTQTLPKGKQRKTLSPETAAILSKEAAHKPDFRKDNAALRDL